MKKAQSLAGFEPSTSPSRGELQAWARVLLIPHIVLVLFSRLLSGKCQPGWTLLDSTCYMYHGGPMTFSQAKEFCAKVSPLLHHLL